MTKIILVIIFLILLGGAFFISTGKSTNGNLQNIPSPSPSTSPTPTNVSTPKPSSADPEPVITFAKSTGWSVLTGQINCGLGNNCYPKFSIEFPSDWKRDGYVFYPYGSSGSKTDPVVIITANGAGWPLEIIENDYSWGEIDHSWGQSPGNDWYDGFTTYYIGGKRNDPNSQYVNYILLARFIPSEKADTMRQTLDHMSSTFHYLGSDFTVDTSSFHFTDKTPNKLIQP